MAGLPERATDRARLLWVAPLVTVIIVLIEMMMTGRFDRSGSIDLALSLFLSAVMIQIAVRLARGTVSVALIYAAGFTLAWYALTFLAVSGTGNLQTGETLLVEDGWLTVEGHIHFLSRPLRFAAFTLLLSFMAVWGLWGSGPKGPE